MQTQMHVHHALNSEHRAEGPIRGRVAASRLHEGCSGWRELQRLHVNQGPFPTFVRGLKPALRSALRLRKCPGRPG